MTNLILLVSKFKVRKVGIVFKTDKLENFVGDQQHSGNTPKIHPESFK